MKKSKISAAKWNAANRIGTKVRYWSLLPICEGDPPPIETVTRSEAWELGSGHPVVLISGRSGGVHLSHLEVLP